MPFGGDGDAADEGFGEGEVVAAELGDGFEDVDGFAGDFGADAVAGEDCDLELHGAFLQRFSGKRTTANAAALTQRARRMANVRDRFT